MEEKVFTEGSYQCSSKVMDAVQGTSLDDALAIRFAEDLIAQRFSDEIRVEVDQLMSELTPDDRSKLVALLVKFPTVSALELHKQLLGWKKHASTE